MVFLTERKQAVKEGAGTFNSAGVLSVINVLSSARKRAYNAIGSDHFFSSLDSAIYEARYLYWLMGKPCNKVTLRKAQMDLNDIWHRIRSQGYGVLASMPPFSWKECKYEFPEESTEEVLVRAPNGKIVAGRVEVTEDFMYYLIDEGVISPENPVAIDAL
jgi:hypothetical protein